MTATGDTREQSTGTKEVVPGGSRIKLPAVAPLPRFRGLLGVEGRGAGTPKDVVPGWEESKAFSGENVRAAGHLLKKGGALLIRN